MLYLITFLEGLISFLSPCFLPMLPVYLAYFAGDAGDGTNDRRTLLHAGLFVLGFSAVFILLGVGAGTLGGLLSRHQTVLNLVCGALVVLFGLSFLEILPLPVFRGASSFDRSVSAVNSLLFGVIFSVSLTPCVGAFLGSALALASSQASVSALLGGLATSTSQETTASTSPRSLRGVLLRRMDAYRSGIGCWR